MVPNDTNTQRNRIGCPPAFSDRSIPFLFLASENPMPSSYLALLRGINVGGKNILPMKGLRELITDLGCENVTTYIQSGNVVFQAKAEQELAGKIEAGILERFGVKSPVILRTLDELKRTVDGNPFLLEGSEESSLHVMFLKEQPSLERIKSLDPERSPGDRFAVVGRDIFLHLQNHAAKTKLTNAYFDSKLATISTGRNWRTVNRLREMMAN